MQHGVGDVGARLVVGARREHALDRLRRAAEEVAALVSGGRQGRVEQLVDDAEGELALDLAAPGRELGESRAGGGPARLVEQAALADSRRSLHEHQAARPPPADVGDCLAQLRDLAVALQQRAHVPVGLHCWRDSGLRRHSAR